MTTIKSTDAERLYAFQQKQAAERRAAGIAPKVHKGEQTPKRDPFLYDSAQGLGGYSFVDQLTPARCEHWRARRALQYAWTQAQAAIKAYDDSGTLQYLYGCMRKAATANNIILLNRVEEISLGSIVTAGSLEQRRRFWTYVDFIRSRRIPSELLVIINIEAAAEIEYQAQVEQNAKAEANARASLSQRARYEGGFRRDEVAVLASFTAADKTQK